MKKYSVNVTVRLIILANDEEAINESLENMEYNFDNTCEESSLEGMEITDWEIANSSNDR